MSDHLYGSNNQDPAVCFIYSMMRGFKRRDSDIQSQYISGAAFLCWIVFFSHFYLFIFLFQSE